MKFQSEKKELWRYASKNLTAPARGMNREQPPPHRLQHQHLPQSHSTQQLSLLGCCDVYGQNSVFSMISVNIARQENANTPPPPYSSVPELNCSSNATMPDFCLTFRHHQTYPTDGETETTISATDSDTGYNRKLPPSRYGSNYVNTGDIMLVDDYEKMKETSTSSSYQLAPELQKKLRRISPHYKSSSDPQLAVSTTTTTSTTSFAATAVKILRNCCGATFGSSNSVAGIPSNTSNNNNCSKINYGHSKRCANHLVNSNDNYLPEQYFSTLMKQLKGSQISLLLKAVKSRHDQGIPITISSSTASSTSSRRCCATTYQSNCILLRRAETLEEEPYLIACRLFFWRDLKYASQLKRLPVCPSERDRVYVCCNPLHWCRILETGQNSIQNAVNSPSYGSTNPNNTRQINSDLRVGVTGSLTTDGAGGRFSPHWCEVAYWELSQRVGERFPADTPIIHILYDKPYTSNEDNKHGMCLKELIEKRRTSSPDDVQYTRQKIGLGITLGQESDGVWLYNRSTVPVFVYSPTLTESWYRVCRVEPGDCLRAFDNYRAQRLVYPSQLPGVQIGPIDKFSMRISFGKGWGYSYKRPDITLCPCWLEVLFKTRR